MNPKNYQIPRLSQYSRTHTNPANVTMAPQITVKSNFLNTFFMYNLNRAESQVYSGHKILKLSEKFTELWLSTL